MARLPVLRGNSCGKFTEHRRAASSALTAAASSYLRWAVGGCGADLSTANTPEQSLSRRSSKAADLTISWSYRPVISLALPSGWSHPHAALEAPRFLEILAALVQHEAGVTPAILTAKAAR